MSHFDIVPSQGERKAEIETYEHELKEIDNQDGNRDGQDQGVSAVAQQTLAEGRSPWKVILANPRLLALIMVVQSNAIIVGVEFSLPGNLLGIQVSRIHPVSATDPLTHH
jgi:hypothetical protein